ncbi:rRNA maturation RNase YbeY [Halodesulfovibrio marinisediminis]|uniref:Endoribonuclease YbeY n=1 Tax=Halodesulfovibrio marinisediminis DSM 17456 TaxID=1121457 RepID=A0A1N6DT13_9BACT|nr:rRNA maturation RNase YbeY [Halodesulfovibrio marinisediminis]SIN73948.1 probable rRNA maturation factor [Halodesulfovibrio marinisediminis DSM 17456]
MITIKKSQSVDWLLPFSRTELTRGMNAMLSAIGHEGKDVEINLVDDATIADLNASFLQCDGPTNILSFPSTEDGSTHNIGWLALSMDTLERECLLYGQDRIEHALRLIAHGMLHLAGYDHGDEMFALTDVAVDAGFASI